MNKIKRKNCHFSALHAAGIFFLKFNFLFVAPEEKHNLVASKLPEGVAKLSACELF